MRLVRISLLISTIERVLRFFSRESYLLCKPSTSSRVCITVSNSPNPSRVLSGYANTENVFYCSSSTAWHFCRASDKGKVERFQERALRIVFNSKLDSYEVFNETAILRHFSTDKDIAMFKAKTTEVFTRPFHNPGGRKKTMYTEEL